MRPQYIYGNSKTIRSIKKFQKEDYLFYTNQARKGKKDSNLNILNSLQVNKVYFNMTLVIKLEKH